MPLPTTPLLLRWLLLLWVLVFASSCGKPPEPPAEDFLPNKNLKVVTSSVQLAELVTQLGGDAVTVECLTTPKVAPKPDDTVNDRPLWNPNPFSLSVRAADLFSMQTAHLVVLNGLGVERSLELEVPKLREQGVNVVIVGDTIPAEERIMDENGSVDPCYWNSPRMWKYAIRAVSEGLQQLVRKEAATYFEYRAHPLEERMNRLMLWGEEKLKYSKPKGQRFLLTSHNTMGYFARDFGIEARALWSARDGSSLIKDDTEFLGWLEKRGVSDLLLDASTPQDTALIDVSAKFRIFASRPTYTIFNGRPGTRQLGKLESFDVGTFEGAFQQLIRTMESRLGGSRSKAPVDEPPEAAAERKSPDRLDAPVK
jgi:zinc/manganese transport system substrate-binding protein